MPRLPLLLVLACWLAAACTPPSVEPTPRPTSRPTTPTAAPPTAVPTPGRAPAPIAPPPPPPAATTPTKWGIHLLLDDGVTQWPTEVWSEHLMYARWLVGRGGYVVELIRADDLDVVKWQQFLDDAARLGLQPIIRLATWQDRAAGHWVAPPLDDDGRGYRQIAERWAQFLGALRYDGTLYVVVGNEPNRGDEWGGQPNPAEYSRYLMDVSAALRQRGQRNLKILNGALDQYAPDTGGEAIDGFRAIDAVSFLQGMQAADPGVWDAIDVWAAHCYPLGPFSAPPGRQEFQVDDALAGGPRTRQPPWPGLVNRGVNSYRWELFQLAGFGVKRQFQVFITETGWRHRESQTSSGDDHGATIAGDQAAEYIRLAFEGDPKVDPRELSWTPWGADRDVGAVVLFALGGEPSRWGHTNLLVLGENGRVLGLSPHFAGLIKRP